MAVIGCRACPSIGMAKVPWKACGCIRGLNSVPGCSNRSKINRHLRKTGPLRRWSGLKEGTRRGHGGKRAVQIFANSKADDSVPSEMSLESALKLLGVAEGASFEEILRAKNAILDRNKDDQEVAAQVEAAYDMMLMQSLTQRRAGKVVDSTIRYADVKQLGTSGIGGVPEWLKNSLKNAPISIEAPSVNDLGIQTGVYGALMAWTVVSGVSYTGGGPLSNAGADVPGLILASGFGASLYFLCKKNIKLGKATVITVGSLVAGAVLGGAVESWLQVDIVPLFGIRSPAVVVSEFVLLSQWLSSLYLR